MNKVAVALAATMLVISVAAVHFWRELHGGREELVTLQAQVSELEAARLAAATAAPPVPAPVVSNLEPAPIVSSPEKPAAPATPVPAPPASKPSAERSTAAMAAGVMESMMSPEGLRRMMSQAYPDLAAEMGISQAEADKLLDLLARHQAGSMGDSLAMLTGSGAAAQEAQLRLAEQEQANRKEMSAMLGGKYPQWEQYQGTVAARAQVDQLRTMLGSGENALTEAQSKPLITALGAETARVNREAQDKMLADARDSKNLMQEQLRYTAEQNHRLIDVATPHLTSTQLDRYKQVLKQQEDMMKMVMGAMGGAEGAPSQGGAPR